MRSALALVVLALAAGDAFATVEDLNVDKTDTVTKRKLEAAEYLSQRGASAGRADAASHQAGRAFQGASRRPVALGGNSSLIDSPYRPMTRGPSSSTGGPMAAPQPQTISNATPYQSQIDEIRNLFRQAIEGIKSAARQLRQTFGRVGMVGLTFFIGTIVYLGSRVAWFASRTDQIAQGELLKKKADEVTAINSEIMSGRVPSEGEIDARLRQAGREWKQEIETYVDPDKDVSGPPLP